MRLLHSPGNEVAVCGLGHCRSCCRCRRLPLSLACPTGPAAQQHLTLPAVPTPQQPVGALLQTSPAAGGTSGGPLGSEPVPWQPAASSAGTAAAGGGWYMNGASRASEEQGWQ